MNLLRIFDSLASIRSSDPQDDGHKFMLLVVLSLSLIATLIMAASDINRPQMLAFAVIIIMTIWAALRGHLFIAGMVPSITGFLLFTSFIYNNNGLRDTSILGLPLIIIAASLMTGWRGSLLFGALSMAAILGLWFGESQGWLHYPITLDNFTADYLSVILVLALVTALQWAVVRRLDNTIKRVKDELRERHRVVSALMESEARYRLLVTEAPLGIVILNADGRIEQANPAATSMTGYTFEDMQHLDPQALIATTRIGISEQEMDLLRAGNTVQSEQLLRCKTGKKLPVMGSIKQMPDGRVQYIFQDVSMVKQAEAEIRTLNQELERRVLERTNQLQAANEELEAFAYSVSHDLRAPLRAINGYASLLEEELGLPLESEGVLFLNNIRRSAQHMDQMITALLQLSRLNRSHLEFTTIDCRALVDSLINALPPEEKQVTWDIRPLPECVADVTLMRQVYANLIGNAIKYSRRQPEIHIEIGGSRSANELTYYIKDNGVGFDPKYAERIFSAFQRLHAEDQFEGTGIGLATVKRIIQRHGGRVWCEAQPDQGATFYFALPVRYDPLPGNVI